MLSFINRKFYIWEKSFQYAFANFSWTSLWHSNIFCLQWEVSANEVVKVAKLNVLVFSINLEWFILRERHIREMLEFESNPELWFTVIRLLTFAIKMCDCTQLYSPWRWPTSKQTDLRKHLGGSGKRWHFIVAQRKVEGQYSSDTGVIMIMEGFF